MLYIFALGVQNISALNHVISWQKLQYDFGFYKTDFLTNVVRYEERNLYPNPNPNLSANPIGCLTLILA